MTRHQTDLRLDRQGPAGAYRHARVNLSTLATLGRARQTCVRPRPRVSVAVRPDGG